LCCTKSISLMCAQDDDKNLTVIKTTSNSNSELYSMNENRYLVATAVAGGALWWWTSSTLGFLSEDSATVLPRLPWLPLLGGASDEWGNGTGKGVCNPHTTIFFPR